jgi:transcriptional regulatory protein LEU3
MALLTLESHGNPMETLQGLLLLCLWPVSTNTMYKDMSHVMSGAALHLAMQIGLHVTGTGQDFARTPLLSDAHQLLKCSRSDLWVQCLIIYHGLVKWMFWFVLPCSLGIARVSVRECYH